MTAELQALLDRLRPRDIEVLRALVANPGLAEADVAKTLGIGLHNLRARVKHAYAVLGVETRVHFYAIFHHVLLGE